MSAIAVYIGMIWVGVVGGLGVLVYKYERLRRCDALARLYERGGRKEYTIAYNIKRAARIGARIAVLVARRHLIPLAIRMLRYTFYYGIVFGRLAIRKYKAFVGALEGRRTIKKRRSPSSYLTRMNGNNGNEKSETERRIET